MTLSHRLGWSTFFVLICVGLFFLTLPEAAEARSITEYKDTISTSAPGVRANHTLEFNLRTALSPSSYIEIIPPSGFEILSTSTFSARNVQMFVNGSARTASDTLSATTDLVTITPGTPGSIRYTLNPIAGIADNASIELRIGDHTSNAINGGTIYSSSTGTTTLPDDIKPIVNANATGTYVVDVRVYDGTEVANAGFHIVMIEQVGAGPVDTTETIPPFRFNPAPTSTVGGTTLSVEISLETDELAICRYATASGTPYASMTNTFSNTGLIFHSTVVAVTPNSVQRFYVRCIDDEDNFNTDDFIIIFAVTDTPAGTANTEGDVSGDGSGTGDDGTGDGSGSGGATGASDGGANTSGGSSGGGGSGGGSGTSGQGDGGTEVGGGLDEDGPYESGDGEVVITGYAFPGSQVTVLVDGVRAETTTAGSSGSYSVTLEEIARGVYTFGVYAVDDNGTRSSTFSTSFTVTGSRQSKLSNINVMPSILVEPDPVDVGQTVTISGFSIPNAVITLENQKDGTSVSLKEFTTTSDGGGEWSIDIETSGFSQGTYKVRAKAKQEGGLGISTNYSGYTFYGVGQEAEVTLNADLNRDGDVNLIDFSILLFWWGSDGGSSNPPADINRDGTVSLTDFSILLFNWTG